MDEEKRFSDEDVERNDANDEAEIPEVEPVDDEKFATYDEDTTSKKGKNKNIAIIAVAALLVLALVASAMTGLFGNFLGDAPPVGNGDQIALDGLQDEQLDHDTPLVSVNGEEITAGDLQMLMQQEKQRYMAQGMDIDSPEMSEVRQEIEAMALDRLIGMKLLEQKAMEEGHLASEDQIKERFLEYAEMFGGEEEFLVQIEAMDMDRSDLDEEIGREMAIDLFLEVYIQKLEDSGKLDHSEEDILDLYAEYEDQIDDEFEDIKDDLALMVRNEKEHEHINMLIEELKEDSDINFLM